MKYFTHRREGSAAIVKARNKEHAAAVLTSELRQRGLEQKKPIDPNSMVLWPLVGEQVRILNDGDY